MKDLIRISKYGSISVLGVSIGCKMKTAEEILEGYGFMQNDRSLYKNGLSFENLPPFKLSFLLDCDKCVCEILISNPNLSQIECNSLYDYFLNYLGNFNKFSEERTEKAKRDIFVNAIHNVQLVRQIGFSDNPNIFPFIFDVTGRLLSCDKNQIRSLYTNNETVVVQNKSDMRKNLLSTKNVFITIIVISLLAMIYLFLLNDRYMKLQGIVVFDKWTGQSIVKPIVND